MNDSGLRGEIVTTGDDPTGDTGVSVYNIVTLRSNGVNILKLSNIVTTRKTTEITTVNEARSNLFTGNLFRAFRQTGITGTDKDIDNNFII